MTDPEPSGTRSGRLIVVAMLVGIVGILALFNRAVTVFGPPEPAMPIQLESDFPAEVDVLVRPAGEGSWSLLLGGAGQAPLSAGEGREVQLIAGETLAWRLAFRAGGRWLGQVSVEARPAAQLGLRLDAEGRLFRRDGASSLPLARQMHLPEHEVDAPEPVEAGPPLPPVGLELPAAPDLWAFGAPRPDS